MTYNIKLIMSLETFARCKRLVIKLNNIRNISQNFEIISEIQDHDTHLQEAFNWSLESSKRPLRIH